MKKQGFTIVELLVSMAIFSIVTTLAVGAFVSINRFRDLGSNMAESQQKLRIANEMITRFSRQAEDVVISPDGKTLDLGFNMDGLDPVTGTGTPNAAYNTFVRFWLSNNTLYFYSEKPCVSFSSGGCTVRPYDDTSDDTPTDLLSGVDGLNFKLNSGSKFDIPPSATLPLRMNLVLDGSIGSGANSDTFKIDTSIILENLGE